MARDRLSRPAKTLHFILAVSWSLLAACALERTHPDDQVRCTPSCTTGQRCSLGTCIPDGAFPKDGALNDLTDGHVAETSSDGVGDFDGGADDARLDSGARDLNPELASSDAFLDAVAGDTVQLPPVDLTADSLAADATIDATPDATVDAKTILPVDLGVPDTSINVPLPDATFDTLPPDATTDSTFDATFDTLPPDATTDATFDATFDTLPPDASVDAAPAVLLEPSGIAVSTATGAQTLPSVAYGGGNYLIVWTDERNGNKDIYGTLMGTDGTVVNPTGIPISTKTGDEDTTGISYDGSQFIVVWADTRSGNSDIYAARVSTAGAVNDVDGIPISTKAGEQYRPVVASGNNQESLVVWEDASGSYYQLAAARLTTAGVLLDQTQINVVNSPGANQRVPAVELHGANYLVAWYDRRSAVDYDIYTARVSLAGAPLDGAGLAVCTAVNEQYAPHIASNGTTALIAWLDYRDPARRVYLSRFANGQVLDPTPNIMVGGHYGKESTPSLAFNGSYFFVAYEHGYTAWDVSGHRLLESGLSVEKNNQGILISAATGDQQKADVATDGLDFFIAWQDTRGADTDIYAARVRP